MESGRIDLISAIVPTLVLALLAIGAVSVWVGTHFLARRVKGAWQVRTFFLVRAVAGTVAAWLCIQTAGRFLAFGTSWSLWFSAFVSAVSVELIVWLYALERRTVPKRTGTALLALRLIALITVLFMLLQPVYSKETDKTVERIVAVMVDDSLSMRFVDTQLKVSQWCDLAELYGLEEMKGRPRLGNVLRELQPVVAKINREITLLGLSSASDDASTAQAIEQRRKVLIETLKESGKVIRSQMKIIEGTLGREELLGGSKNAIDEIRRSLGETTSTAIEDVLKALATRKSQVLLENVGLIREQLDLIGKELKVVVSKLPGAIDDVDRAFSETLSEASRGKVDRIVKRTRVAIAREVLTGERKGDGLAKAISDKYTLKVFYFAATPAELDTAKLLENQPVTDRAGITDGEDDGLSRNVTDITAAIDRVLKDISGENLAGILLLTDGRHNGAVGVDEIARRAGVQGIPICTMLMGSRLSPPDAAVLAVRAPESVYTDDKVIIKADIGMEQLMGKTLKAVLVHDGETVDEKEVRAGPEHYRTTVTFEHTPKEEGGILQYSIELQVEGDSVGRNNRWEGCVAITEDRTNVLLVEGRPRWEFRYLRNLFYGRDKSVHLQYVLLNPDRIGGQDQEQNRPVIHASVSRKFGEAEATALPKSREEWMKFNVIVLGDIPPSALDEETLATIDECVSKRGAMLTVIAGPRYMPHAYDSQRLKDMLPVRYTVDPNPQFAGIEPAFRLSLTPDGRTHPVMQMSADPSETDEVWTSLMPIMHWRHAVVGVKEGATVLAYAMPKEMGTDEAEDTEAEEKDVTPSAADLEKARKLQSQNALISLQKYGLGRVVMLGFDQIWRLRYMTGDKYHHGFWGQAIRWGIGERMRAGTDLIRLGTDKLKYTTSEPVGVIARVLTAEYEPVKSSDIYINLYLGERRIARKAMTVREEAGGMYDAQLGPLPEQGKYRIELEGNEIAKILSGGDVNKIETEFAVGSEESMIEMAELSASPDIPEKMADLSGGTVTDVLGARQALAALGPGTETLKVRHDLNLWDSWLLLLLLISSLTAEWILRKRGGLT